jgi:uncharacterized protein YbjT (DUF2867 family)
MMSSYLFLVCFVVSVSMAHTFRVAVLGGSGGVGSLVVQKLLHHSSFHQVDLFNRRPLEIQNDKVRERIVDMNALYEQSLPHLHGVDVAIVTMGTGAPSKTTPEELERVDVTLPTEFARAAKEANVPHILLLTSAGANPESVPCRLTGTAAGGGLYLLLKGKVEENFKSLNFVSVTFFRPAAITNLPNTPNIMNTISPFVDHLVPAKYHSISSDDLAEVIVRQAVKVLESETKGQFVFEGQSLQDLRKE